MPYAINGRVSTDPITGGIEITPGQYSAAITGIGLGKVVTIDGGFAVIDPPEPEPAPEPTEPTLSEVKATMRGRIDAEAEAARLKFITGGAGQAMTYQQKATEAAVCLTESEPDPADYPLLAAEVGITAESLLAVAQIVHDAHQQWRVIGAQIEALRLSAKAAVSAAETPEDTQVAAAVAWP